jgi:beta-barrel assembly-enhancing protease
VRIRPALARLVLVALSVSACATRLPPIGMDGQPFTPDADERLLWAQGEREATALLERVRLYEDPFLDAYLARLGDRLAPDGARAAGAPVLRFRVLRDPTLSAFALPDGRVFVHTGLLAAVENEAQLALVLAREIVHVVHRHALAVSRAGGLRPVRFEGTAPLGPTASAIASASASLASLAALNGYGTRLEREADAAALAGLARGGWDVTAAIAVYTVLARDASERGALETFLLGSATTLRTRLDSMRGLAAATTTKGGFRTSEEFETRRLVASRENAAEDVRLGRFALARRQLDRVLSAAPADARAQVYYGDLHRLRSQRAESAAERDAELEQALVRYGRALALDPTLADAHRQLGFLYVQKKDVVRARAELRAYLQLAAGAPDAGRVAEYVRELER